MDDTMLHMEISTSLCLTEGRKRPLLSAPSITDQTQVRSRKVRSSPSRCMDNCSGCMCEAF